MEFFFPCMHSPQTKPSLGKLKLKILFGNGLLVIIQLNVLFFIISIKFWTAFVSDETGGFESHDSVLHFLIGDDLFLHRVCSGHCSVMNGGKWHLAEAIDLWKREESWFQDWDLMFYNIVHREKGSTGLLLKVCLRLWDTSHHPDGVLEKVFGLPNYPLWVVFYGAEWFQGPSYCYFCFRRDQRRALQSLLSNQQLKVNNTGASALLSKSWRTLKHRVILLLPVGVPRHPHHPHQSTSPHLPKNN